MNKAFLILILLIIVVVAGIAISQNRAGGDIPMDQVVDDMMTGDAMEQSDAMDQVDAMAESDDVMMQQDDTVVEDTMEDGGDTMVADEEVMEEDSAESVPVQTAGSFEDYAPEKLARADSGDVVLFFHASWCPSCRLLASNIEKNLADIPAGLTILKTDYDSENALKQKYGVTYQHTIVQVDSVGNMIKKWSGGSQLSSITSQVQ